MERPNGKIGPGRSLYTDDYYDDRNLSFSDDETDDPIWDLDEMMIERREAQNLVGDEAEQVTHYGKGPKGYIRSDRLIHEEVCEALKEDRWVDAGGIDVTVDKGTVYLRGEIADRKMKREAESCIERVSSVVDIINELKVKKR